MAHASRAQHPVQGRSLPRHRRPGSRRRATAVGVALVLATISAGCTSNPLDDRVRIAGSETLRGLLSAVVGDFATEHESADVRIELSGTADGLTLLCDGLVEVAAASRPINTREQSACRESGVQPVELKVALDAVSVITTPGSGPNCLTLSELYAATGPESTGFDDWADVSALAQRIGDGDRSSDLPQPSTPLAVVAPRSGSGTLDSFVGFAIEPIAKERDASPDLRADWRSTPSSGLILSETLSGAANLGIVGFAEAAKWGDRVQRVAIQQDGSCVEPTTATVGSGAYPFGRALYVYVDGASLQTNPTEVALVDFLLSNKGQELAEPSGTIALPSKELATTRGRWAEARG